MGRVEEVSGIEPKARAPDPRTYETEGGAMSLRRITPVFVGVVALVAAALGTARGTPSSGVTAETARGPLVDRPLDVNMKFPGTGKVKLKTRGQIEIANQRIVAAPGASFGWHSHPGPTVVTVLRGTLSLYHAGVEDDDEDADDKDEGEEEEEGNCAQRIDFGPGTSFSNLPPEIHLARNNGTEELVIYAFYFVPKTSPPVALRIDQPLPAPGCPQ
jgi:hypothetical protein